MISLKFKTKNNYIMLLPLLVCPFLIVPSIPPETAVNWVSIACAILIAIGVIWLFNKTNLSNSITFEEKYLDIPYDLNGNAIGKIPYVFIISANQDSSAAGKDGILIEYLDNYSKQKIIFRVKETEAFINELKKHASKLNQIEEMLSEAKKGAEI